MKKITFLSLGAAASLTAGCSNPTQEVVDVYGQQVQDAIDTTEQNCQTTEQRINNESGDIIFIPLRFDGQILNETTDRFYNLDESNTTDDGRWVTVDGTYAHVTDEAYYTCENTVN